MAAKETESKAKEGKKVATCLHCGRRAGKIEAGHLPGAYCGPCFIGLIERRVKKKARIEGYLERAKDLTFIDDGTCNSAVARYFLKNLTEHRDVRIKSVKANNPCINYELVVLPLDADSLSEGFIEDMAGKGPRNTIGRMWAPIGCLSSREVTMFAHLKGIKGRQPKPAESTIHSMLGRLRQDSPDLSFAVLRSKVVIESALKEKRKKENNITTS